MKQGIPYLLLVGVIGFTLTGCVTERTYTGTDIPVAQRDINKHSAARERMQLGLTYLRRGNGEQAKYNLDKAVEFAPDLSEVHVAMAYFYQTVGDLERTEQSYRNAINTNDATGDAKNNFGVFLCQQKKYAESEAMLLDAIETPKYTRTASSYENLGVCSKNAGNLDKARHYFNMALKYDSRRANTLIGLTELDMESSDYVSARNMLEKYHSVANETAESLALGIEIEQNLGNFDAMKNFGIKLIAKFPASPQAKEYRANLH
ncbi:type IV pilus biogenesis/stability protein PilW [Shewanella gaetbuli]|uniref:Type IV pilus biogenesis/stability protein PilW n=1 Tax=Shewanella gaetbuli TaxID=220752 RepID=A0A9X1ZHC3_9GAMM|nr:type IV pilus biogenesis/stability protein PilW [Shewanella gaetbuli]MCL1141758.1 type IV pilus biogenesis/stability protein PilW [Shewanella gaetbuli]